MIILQITQLKNFMNTLLRLETFDRFPVSEASITTFTTFSIDGSLHTDFFDPDDAQLLKEKGRTRLLWKDVKSFCYSVIKGKRTPLQFKFVFQLPQAACEKMIADHALPLEIENVFGCFLNFQYKDGKLLLTTGTSLKIFTMDKSLDRVFDEEVRQFLLKNALDSLRDDYDFIFIDCPPSLELLTLNALCAADSLLVPLQGEYYALEGLSDLMNTVRIVRRNMNPRLQIEGVLLTMFDGRTNLAIQVAQEVKRFFPGKVYSTVIPRNVRLSEAPSHGKPITAYDRLCRGAEAYMNLSAEFLKRNA